MMRTGHVPMNLSMPKIDFKTTIQLWPCQLSASLWAGMTLNCQVHALMPLISTDMSLLAHCECPGQDTNVPGEWSVIDQWETRICGDWPIRGLEKLHSHVTGPWCPTVSMFQCFTASFMIKISTKFGFIQRYLMENGVSRNTIILLVIKKEEAQIRIDFTIWQIFHANKVE